ncbi:MAG: DUF4198 domain-containing protein [Parvularcula sp.]|jgi:uncharacterized GH25 family protein|nr:DUF4198 domain-containing protein [Parvularcula sp.]
MIKTFIAACSSAVVAFALSSPIMAHELFLKPESYKLAPSSPAVVALVNGTFEESDNTIDRDRMVDVTLHGGGKTDHPDLSRWRDVDLSTVLDTEVGNPGTYVLGVSTKPRIITLSADEFKDYLAHDGVTDALEAFEKEGKSTDVRERYSKHVRTVLQVGDTVSDEHERSLGYPIEIVLEDNPYAADPGDTLTFRVLRQGVPVAGQLVYASYDGFQTEGEGHQRALTMRTDSDGRGRFSPTQAGVWYLTLIHMKKLESDPNADYESNWATVTFKIG